MEWESDNVDTNKWIAVGFGDSMKDTDMVFCTAIGNNPSCWDMFSLDTETQVRDTSDNVELVDSEYKDGEFFKAMFRRKLDTGDQSQDRRLEPKEKMKLVWARGDSSGSSAYPSFSQATDHGVTSEVAKIGHGHIITTFLVFCSLFSLMM